MSPTRRLVGDGDLDASSVRAPAAGLVEICVRPLDRVEAGEPVARWTDPWFGNRMDLLAAESGVAVVARRSRAVAADEMIVHIAQDEAAQAADQPDADRRGWSAAVSP